MVREQAEGVVRAVRDAGEPRLGELRDRLLALGGDEVVLVGLDRDLGVIRDCWQVWPGAGARLMSGRPWACHANVADLWAHGRRAGCAVQIATGYARSAPSPDDSRGLWRQHSWAAETTASAMAVLKATAPRDLYVGALLTDEEAEALP